MFNPDGLRYVASTVPKPIYPLCPQFAAIA
jgi:hypothetical protein